MTQSCVLVAGASGLVGSAAIGEFAAAGWKVIGLSRRPPADRVADVRYMPLDLLDVAACRDAVDAFADVSHLVYAAVNETPGNLIASWSDPAHAGRNGQMFANLLDALVDHSPGFRHASLIHGTKAYAPHRPGHLPVPLRETLPRPDFDDFYFRQEDHLRARAAERALAWTVLRAQIVVGGGRDQSQRFARDLRLRVLAQGRRARPAASGNRQRFRQHRDDRCPAAGA